MKVRVSGFAMMVGVLSTGVAFGQEAEDEMMETTAVDESAEAPPVEDPAAEAPTDGVLVGAAPATPAVPTKPNSAAGDDGARFRFGISGGAGFLSNSTVPTGFYGGGDLRLGAQVSDMIGVFAQGQLGYYGVDGYPVGGGLVGISALVEATLMDRFFVGAGGGFGVINNPSGPELHFRLGGYPLVKRSDDKIRRKGLSLGMDLRFFFVNGYDPFISPTFNIGYEAF